MQVTEEGKLRSRITRTGRKLRVGLMRVKQKLEKTRETGLRYFAKSYALVWFKYFNANVKFRNWFQQHSTISYLAIIVSGLFATSFSIPVLQKYLQSVSVKDNHFQQLQQLYLTLGGALIGACAIVTSLVLFSMQVNVERLPHGLFRKFSMDGRLIGAFGLAMVLAITVLILSVAPNENWIGFSVFYSIWSTVIILFLFLFAYRRALALVNPLQQLSILNSSVQKEFDFWSNNAVRARPLLSNGTEKKINSKGPFSTNHDIERATYFIANPYWTDGAKQGIRYAISIARRYAEEGDHEVSGAALNVILDINRKYVLAKGHTFFCDNVLFENPFTSDSFIMDTLEHLRQTSQIAISRGDEHQIRQNLNAIAALVHVYSSIDYSVEHGSKTHAHIAAGYLTGEVERLLALKSPDLLMEGARAIGSCANVLLVQEGPNSITSLVEKLMHVGCFGIQSSEFKPVTLTCMEQLADLSLKLILTPSVDVHFAAQRLRRNVTQLTKVFLTLPDAQVSSTHSFYLGPYYSSTDSSALSSKLDLLLNALNSTNSEDQNAKRTLGNLQQWADGIYENEKEVMLLAIRLRSHFTFDILYWIAHVAKILLAAANIPACNSHTGDKLEKDALWLMSVLSFIPDDKETLQFLQTYRISEIMYESAADAIERLRPEFALNICDLLVGWMFKKFQHVPDAPSFTKTICGLAVLSIRIEEFSSVERLKLKLQKKLADQSLLSDDKRKEIAQEIRHRAKTLNRGGHWSSQIETDVTNSDHARLKPLLFELADIFSTIE
jgi:hypothetical protein